MDELLMSIARARGGFAFRGDFIDAGLTDRDIREACRAGLLVRLRHGTYAPQSVVSPLSPEEMHVLMARAVMARLGDGYALSHMSAAMLRTPVSFATDLTVVHVIRRDERQSRAEAGVVFHGGTINDDEIEIIDGLPTVTALRAAFGSAAVSTTESGLVVMNALLHGEHIELGELVEFGERSHRWPGSRHARLAVRLAEPRCESVGESRSMFMFWKEGLPRPEVQSVIDVGDGAGSPRVDFEWWKFRHVGEFDGMVKYGRLNTGIDQADVLVREKVREDRIRSTNRGMSRWTYGDLDRRVSSLTCARIRRAMEHSRRQFARNAVQIPLGVD